MISLQTLNELDQVTFTVTLGHLFEHTPHIATMVWPERPFASRKAATRVTGGDE
jgi:2-oxo-4-hydroxy-4-carboxy--5-ureidoimidazoline (OHCU) decarboxylase